MPTSNARVVTQSASRYLQQLCKHWAHKFEVEFDPHHGTIALPAGRTTLDATDDALRVAISCEDAADLDRIEAVVADHIKRFAFREELEFAWVRDEAGA
ncbi:DUF2218 domain-containing protein [Aureimonas sp. ME7]|uniref:DUF2218 domain-containing protein n=1 Tax=Aureimonas sp. ME7 TaxID=2744252 RepID=UPI0015F5C8E3|nr:DUF2218 domain-containing protein [Aureimonas sp. ME7]